jgi:protein involved in polysaccharide export with SLBB domain
MTRSSGFKMLFTAALCGVILGASAGFAADAPAKPNGKETPPVAVKPVVVPDSYRLQVGDTIEVGVLPRMEFDCGGTILPDGSLALKNVGVIRAAGLTLKELSDKVRVELEKELRKPEITVSITKLGAAPRVTVVGAVAMPGAVDLQEGLRVRKALELVGGALKEADLSRVLLIRRDLSRRVLDLSTDERASDPKQNVLLDNLDSLEVPLRPNKVTVTGAVLKPGPVDLEKDLRLRKAVDLAGGPLKEADLTKVVLVHRDLSRITVDLSTPESASNPQLNLLLQDADSIEVPLIPNNVTIGGAVLKPGAIELEKDLRVRKAIDLAGGTIKDADLSKVVITRKDLKREVVDLSTKERLADPKSNVVLQDGDSVEVPLAFDQGYVGIGGAVVKASQFELKPDMALEDLIVAAGKLTQLADVQHIQLRRVGQPLRTINLFEQQQKGIEGKVTLKPGDQVFIPELKEVIFLVGALPFPGPQPLQSGQTVREFFTSAETFNARAGFNPDNQQTVPNTGPAAALDGRMVDLKKAQLIRKDQTAIPLNLPDILRKPNHKNNVALKSGDVIFLPPRDPNRKKGIMDFLQPLYYLFAAGAVF